MGMLRECLHAYVHGSVVHSTQGRGQPRHKINLGLCTMKKKTAIKKNFLFCDHLAAPAVLAAVWRTDQQACFKILPFPLLCCRRSGCFKSPHLWQFCSANWFVLGFRVSRGGLHFLGAPKWARTSFLCYVAFKILKPFFSAIDAFKRKPDTFERTLLLRLFWWGVRKQKW